MDFANENLNDKSLTVFHLCTKVKDNLQIIML